MSVLRIRLLALVCLLGLVCGHAQAGPEDVPDPQARELMEAMVGAWSGVVTQRVVPTGGEPFVFELQTAGVARWAEHGPVVIFEAEGTSAEQGPVASTVTLIAYDPATRGLVCTYNTHADETMAAGRWRGRLEEGVIHWSSPEASEAPEAAEELQGVWRFDVPGVMVTKMHRVLADGTRIIQASRETRVSQGVE